MLQYLRRMGRRSIALTVAIISGVLAMIRELTGWATADIAVGDYRLNVYFLVLIGAVWWIQYQLWAEEKARADDLSAVVHSLRGRFIFKELFTDLRHGEGETGPSAIRLGVWFSNTSEVVIEYQVRQFRITVGGQTYDCITPGRRDTIAPGADDLYSCSQHVPIGSVGPRHIPILLEIELFYGVPSKPLYRWARKMHCDLGRSPRTPFEYLTPPPYVSDAADALLDQGDLSQ